MAHVTTLIETTLRLFVNARILKTLDGELVLALNLFSKLILDDSKMALDSSV